MRYTPNLLEEILRRTDLVDLVSKKVKLARKGRVFWGCCPFHREKTPSFKVENERRIYKCFGCGAGGDAFKWLAQTEGLTFPEAVERLATEAGVELPKWSRDDEDREERRKSLYEIVEAAACFYEAQLYGRPGGVAREYLKSRGLDEAVCRQFRLGYAPAGSPLIEHLKTKGVALDQIVAAGLARMAEEGRAARDFFFDRVMFPISDLRGRMVAFGGRALSSDATPKYINTGETALFAKGRLLYNFAAARALAIKAQSIVVAEGYMDVIALVRAGVGHAVAPLGTALTEDQLELLWRAAPEPILAFDGDEAGLRAAYRAARLALPRLRPGISLRFAFLPPGEDPDSLIRRGSPAAMRATLDDADPLVKVLWRSETEGREFSTPERRAGLERSLSELVTQMTDAKVADYYRRDFEQLVFENFKRRRPESKREDVRRRFQERGRKDYHPQQAESVSSAVKASFIARTRQSGARRRKEEEISRCLFDEPSLAATQGELLAALEFKDRSLDIFRRELLNLAASGFPLESSKIENHLVGRGLIDLVARLSEAAKDEVGGALGEDREARLLRAANSLRELAELEPERVRAIERFTAEPSDESWADAQRLLAGRSLSTD